MLLLKIVNKSLFSHNLIICNYMKYFFCNIKILTMKRPSTMLNIKSLGLIILTFFFDFCDLVIQMGSILEYILQIWPEKKGAEIKNSKMMTFGQLLGGAGGRGRGP